MPMNDMQYLAAYGQFDKDVLVSAGAGSGKTQVLTSRVTDLIVNKHIKPTNLLVLTFTNAAAAEMKARVRLMLEEDGTNPDAISELEQAYITTFDSFNLSMCKKYFYALNISPNLSICDSSSMRMKKIEILNSILDKLYEKKDSKLLEYLNHFTDKKDNELVKKLLILINSIDKKEDSITYLKEYDNNFFSDDSCNKLKKAYFDFLNDMVNHLIDNLNQLESQMGDPKKIEIVDEIISSLSTHEYDKVKSVIQMDLPRKSQKCDTDDFSVCRAVCKEEMKNIASYYSYDNEDDCIKEYKSSYNTISLFKEILIDYYMQIEAYMHEYGIYEFNDIQKLAIKLVKENPNIALSMKNQFKEILIDEYQDTSDLQESFISYFKNDNRFMVGDIKQSIYRFRNANPNIFKDKYESYIAITKDNYPSCKASFKDECGYLIDMNQNFRSRSEVLDDINMMFSSLMTSKVGDADYKESHQMKFGLTLYNDMQCSEEKGFNCDFITYPYDSKTAPADIDYYEGYIIAKDILSKVGKYDVYSKANKCFKKATFDDFCIILDRQDHFQVFKQILEYYHIPVVINADQNIKESYQSMVAINCLKLINYHYLKEFNSDYYHALSSVLRSFLYEMPDDEILQIVSNHNLDNVASKIARELSYDVGKTDNKNIFIRSLNDFGFYKNVIKLDGVDEALHEVEFFAGKLTDLAKMGYDFSSSVEFLSDMISSNNDIKYALDVSSNHGVRMMNIHKSKGLEFPICYFADFNHDYNKDNISSSVGLNSEYGIYCPVYANGVKPTIVKTLNDDMWTRQTVSERLRLFYVALTRAREKMIFIRTKDKISDAKDPSSHKCFGDYFDYILEHTPKVFKNKIELNEDYFSDLDVKKISQKKYNLELESHNEIKYENNSINLDLVSEGHISKRIGHIIDEKTQNLLESGTRYHEILEMLDFKDPYNSLESLNLSQSDKEVIKRVLDMDLFKNISESKTYHEYEFKYMLDLSEYHGIIDLLVVYNDHVEIIDYKLKNFDDEAYDRQLGLYYSFIRSKTDLPIDCYLLSIIDATYRKVEVK